MLGAASRSRWYSVAAAVSWQRQQVRVVVGERHEREDVAGPRVERHHRALALAQLVAGDLLQLGEDREREVADAVLVHEQVGEVLELELPGPAGQLVVVDLLHAGAAEGEAVVPRDVAEQRALGVLPLVLEAVARLHGPGDHHAVGGGDAATRLAEVAQDLASVRGVGVELVGSEDRDAVELHEEDAEADDQRDAQVPDLPRHWASSRWFVSSEIRRRSASST